MDKVLKIKYLILLLYGFTSMFFFYDDFFLQNSPFLKAPHQYNHIAFIAAIFSLGVIFATMTYNFAFYFYIRNTQYLYYAMAQLFVLLSLVNLEALQIYPFTEIYAFQNFYLLDIAQTFLLIFSLLFIQKFFQTYTSTALSQSIKIVLYLSMLDLLLSLIIGHTVITKFVPTVIWIAFILSEAFRHIGKKDVPFYFLMIGWHVVILTLILELTHLLNPYHVSFPFLHIAFALEALLLSFALSYKFKLIDNEQQRQQSLLLQQSRLASMGEMISIIAHQWKQPLTFLSYTLMHIKSFNSEHHEVKESIENAQKQIQSMSKNIEVFRNFYNPSKEKETFSVKQASLNVLTILEETLKMHHIEVEIDVKKDFERFANMNEFEQVILNLINNAKDAFVEQDITEAKIKLTIMPNEIHIEDNAGGMSKTIQKQIFEPYFSTKENHDGIGLYIAKTIIEQEMRASLSIDSHGTFSKFTIKF